MLTVTGFSQRSLFSIYKSFPCPHPYYANEIYEKAYNNSFHASLRTASVKASLAITEAITGTSKE